MNTQMSNEMSDVEKRIGEMEVNPVSARPTKDALEAMLAYLREQLEIERADDTADRNMILTLEALLRHEEELNGFERYAKAALERAEMDGTLDMLATDEAHAILDSQVDDVALAYKINELLDNDTALREAALTDAQRKLDEQAIDTELAVSGAYDRNGEKFTRGYTQEIEDRLFARQEDAIRDELQQPDKREALVVEALASLKASDRYRQLYQRLLDEQMPSIQAEAERRAAAEVRADVERFREGYIADYEIGNTAMTPEAITIELSKFSQKGIDTRKLTPGTRVTVVLGDELEPLRGSFNHEPHIIARSNALRVITLESAGNGEFTPLFDSTDDYSNGSYERNIQNDARVMIGRLKENDEEELSPRLKSGSLFAWDAGYGPVETTLTLLDVQIDGVNARLDPEDYAHLLRG